MEKLMNTLIDSFFKAIYPFRKHEISVDVFDGNGEFICSTKARMMKRK